MPDEQNNGTRQTVGEVRGELSALTREVEHLRADIGRVFERIDGIGRQLDTHLALHEATDTFRQQRRAEMGEVQVGRRHWADRFDRYLGLVVGIVLTFGGWLLLHQLGIK